MLRTIFASRSAGIASPPPPALAAILFASAALLVATPARAQTRPEPRPLPPDGGTVTDEEIGKAIKTGSDWLYRQFDSTSHEIGGASVTVATKQLPQGAPAGSALKGGLDALAVYALMQSGLALRDDPRLLIKGEEMKALVEAMCKMDVSTGHPKTYAHALRATALALDVSNREEAPKGGPDVVRQTLQADAAWCLEACSGGAYTYDVPPGAPKDGKALMAFYNSLHPNNLPAAQPGWDNSNSQYGLLGVWSAAEAGLEVPASYWAMVERHWTESQTGAGTWDYGPQPLPDKLAMTCAGLASLLVTHDYLDPAVMSGSVGRQPFTPAETKGLAWFEQGSNSTSIGGFSNWWGYTLYGVERVGLASGFKNFGTHDWYKDLALQITRAQQPDGSWLSDPVNTSYCLLFLARGRHPVVMNKLRFDGFWANRPRDASVLARFAGKQLERQFNWQVVSAATDWTQWTDSPVLEIASHQPLKLSKDEVDKIRSFVEGGGMLFTNADGDSAAFTTSVNKLCKDLFNAEMVDVPKTHPIFTTETMFKIATPPPLKMYSNGSRIYMLHTPHDIARAWQARDDQRHKMEFQLGVNLFVYNAGRKDFRNRIQSAWVEPPPATAAPSTTVKVARVEYAGNWDPEPGAWRRYANWFQRQTSYKLDALAVKVADLKGVTPAETPVAVLTGTARQNWSPEAVAGVKTYVEAGGVLLIDVTGGTGQFDQSATALLTAAFPAARLEAVPPGHPVLAAGGPGMEDLSKRRLRESALARLGRTGGTLLLLKSGKGRVIWSPLDVTTGLLGADTMGVLGYEPAYAQSLVKNVIFWAMDAPK